MVRRKSDIQADAPGQDSFLDVVANLVGIMIILIMVVGFAAKKAIVEETTASLAASAPSAASRDQLEKELQDSEKATKAVEEDIDKSLQMIEREKFEVAFRRSERDRVLTLITAAERAIQDRRGELDSTQKEQFDISKQLAFAKSQLDEIQRAKSAAERAGPIPGVIEHLPTPMAKTVFGKELHFRLLGHRLAYVPWDELVERLKADAPHRVSKLKDASRITETIGPVQGFWMRYTLKRTERHIQTAGGSGVQQRVELDRFTIMSERDDFGETLESALAPQSELHTILRGSDPSRATVTVWVYPDSFGDFRFIKQDLFKLGFLCAARPLPDGHPIGGSPEGSRSSAQ